MQTKVLLILVSVILQVMHSSYIFILCLFLFYIFFIFIHIYKNILIIYKYKNNIYKNNTNNNYYNYDMVPLHLEILLKLKIAELFGKVSVIDKHNKNITTIQYKNIIPDTTQHNNNLIGKIVCNRFDFYYIPLKFIENYENNSIGIPICYNIDICPFCSGIILDNEVQYKYYKMIKNMELVINTDTNININIDNSIIISNNIYQILKTKFCFELVK
jgi:hypothetical protein